MIKSTLFLTLSALITLSSAAEALELVVVNNYEQSTSPDLWKNAKTDQIPSALLTKQNVSTPSAAYSDIFPRSFLQEELFTVCHKNCQTDDIFRVKNGELDQNDKLQWDVIEQSNVYYWVGKYFKFAQDHLDFGPQHFLKIITNRELRDETKGKKMNNNAFFNPKDVSLSFLPASKNILFKLLGGKINRSGFDPSVIAHEASHYMFHHLFPNAINEEIGGLNEGFADYIANIFLNNPKVGTVMMHGKALRDSSKQVDGSGKLKVYAPHMEVHDLGERVAYALWKTREAAGDKQEMDKLVIDAVLDLARNPYSTIHDFKDKMVSRLPHVVDANELMNVRNLWEIAFTGSPSKIASFAFLDKPIDADSYLGFKVKQTLPEVLARELGTSSIEESNFTILKIEKLSDSQAAILMSTEDDTMTTLRKIK